MNKEKRSESGSVKKNRIAAIYIRVSTIKQESEGYSTQNQLDSARKLAEKNGLEIRDNLIFCEDKSASRNVNNPIDRHNVINSFSNRPKLMSLLEAAKYGEFTDLIVYKRDRLARSLEETIILDNLFEKFEITIHYAQTGENLDNNEDKISQLIHTILSSIAELESNILSTRVKSGNKLCVQSNLWPGGRPPFGYFREIVNSKGSRRHSYLKRSNFEGKIVAYIFSLYLKGYGYQRIANIMNEEFSYIRWNKSKVEAIIKNETYTGRIVWDRRGGRRDSRLHNDRTFSDYKAENEVISKELWKDTVKLRSERTQSKNPHLFNTPFLLKDKLICGYCGRIMKPKNPGAKRTNVYRCATNKEDRDICNCIIPSEEVETVFLNKLSNLIAINDIQYFYKLYEEKFDSKIDIYKGLIADINPKIDACESTLRSLEHLLADEDSNAIKTALNNQHIVISKLLEQYKSSRELYKVKAESIRLTSEEFSDNLNMFINSLFTDLKGIHVDKDILLMNRRTFIIKYIDKVIVTYNKSEKYIEDIEIEFISSKEL